jgi:hypothetical protein
MGKKRGLKYTLPDDWFRYDAAALVGPIARSEALLGALGSLPYRREWRAEALSDELRAEAAATCRLAGFDPGRTGPDPLSPNVPESGGARAQEAAEAACRWAIQSLPAQQVVTMESLRELNRRALIPGEESPGALRPREAPVSFGLLPQRGARGGPDCEAALQAFLVALAEARGYQPASVRALAAHYHLAAIHPFHEGNGRTARLLEALIRGTEETAAGHFVAASPFYAGRKESYLHALAESRRGGHDLTPFLSFALRGLISRAERHLERLRRQVGYAVLRDTMADLFARISGGKRLALVGRQTALLETLMEAERLPLEALYGQAGVRYASLRSPWKAFLRDVQDLLAVSAIDLQGDPPAVSLRADWPATITEERFLAHYTGTSRSAVALSDVV